MTGAHEHETHRDKTRNARAEQQSIRAARRGYSRLACLAVSAASRDHRECHIQLTKISAAMSQPERGMSHHGPTIATTSALSAPAPRETATRTPTEGPCRRDWLSSEEGERGLIRIA